MSWWRDERAPRNAATPHGREILDVALCADSLLLLHCSELLDEGTKIGSCASRLLLCFDLVGRAACPSVAAWLPSLFHCDRCKIDLCRHNGAIMIDLGKKIRADCCLEPIDVTGVPFWPLDCTVRIEALEVELEFPSMPKCHL